MICPRCSQETELNHLKYWYCERCDVDYVAGSWGKEASPGTDFFVWDNGETLIYDNHKVIHKATGLLLMNEVLKILKNKAFI